MRWAAITVVLAACGNGETPGACDPQACAAEGRLCDGELCVDPWRWGSPTFSACEDEPQATTESLAEKATGYDARAWTLHIGAQTPWVLDVQLRPDVDPLTATAADVAAWRSGENDGLWNALYMASQAYRYAVTRDPEVRSGLQTLLAAEQRRMDITGVPGLFTRQLIPPGIPELSCPTDPAVYVPTADKRGNRWVMIGDDGCAQVADPDTLQLASTTHCGLQEFAGWCFLDNVSQDEYVGHMFALGAVARLVDDPEVRGMAVAMLYDIGRHLVDHDMELTDWDGRPTQWGKVHPGAAGDTPGYLAVMGMSFMAVAADATGDPVIIAAHDQVAADYPAYLDQIFLWEGDDGCLSNWNNISMVAANFHHLLWHEHDPARRVPLQDAFAGELMRAPLSRAALAQHNAWYDLMWAAQKPLGPDSDGPAYADVEDAVCQLRQFPASNHTVARDLTALAPHACDGRRGESLAAEPFDIADRCAATFAYWGNPYERATCPDAPELVQQPASYLLPYWMGRYYGFIPADG